MSNINHFFGIDLWDPNMIPMFFSIISSLILGSLIGLERSKRGRAAGFRTYALVALSCAAVVSAAFTTSSLLVDKNITQNNFQMIGHLLDPTSRIIQGLLTGIGFLGGGVILRDGANIKGLTSAASIWLTSGIGILCGFQLFLPAIVVTIIALIILTLFRVIEDKVSKESYVSFEITLSENTYLDDSTVKQWFLAQGLTVVEMAFAKKKQRIEYLGTVMYQDINSPNKMARFLATNNDVAGFHISTSSEDNKALLRTTDSSN